MSGISCPLLQAGMLTRAIPSPNCRVLGPLVFSPGETRPKGVRLAGLQKAGSAGGPVLLTMETCEICRVQARKRAGTLGRGCLIPASYTRNSKGFVL